MSGKEDVCEFVMLAVKRHVEDLERQKDKNFDFIFSEDQANRALSFFRSIKHTSGKLAGTPFNLQDNQAFKTAMIFGWRQKNGGDRRFSQVYIEEARKGGKSQYAAAVELYCGICEGEEGAEVYTAATTRDQADMVFKAAKKMATYLRGDSPAMKKAISVMAHSIVLNHTDSFIQKVSADAGTLDGLNPHCAVIDEYHAHKTDLVKGVMQTGMGSRSNPMLMIITTAGFDKEAPCYKVERANAVAVLRGERRQDNLFAIIFTLSEDEQGRIISLDPDIPSDAKEILRLAKKANPNLGSTPTVKYILDQVRDARNKGATTRVQVLTKNFNCWVDAPTIWIPEEDVKACMAPITLEDLAGRECHAGIDLASVSDIAALDLFFPEVGDLPAAGISFFFLPEETIEKRKNDTSYLDWVEKGYIIKTPGNIIDYDYIKNKLIELSFLVKIRTVSYDQWNSYQMVIDLTEHGFEMQRCGQNFANLSEPCKKIEKMIVSRDFVMQESPVLEWMFRNVVMDRDANDNIKPNKKKSASKIDGISAKAMSVFGWLVTLGAPKGGSYLFED